MGGTPGRDPGTAYPEVRERIYSGQAPWPPGFRKALAARVTYQNPDHGKRRSLGYSTHGIPARICLLEALQGPGEPWAVPRGLTGVIRALAGEYGLGVVFRDQTRVAPVEFLGYRGKPPRPYQDHAVERILARRQGIIRAPTGSGKTAIALQFLARANQRALVIMRDARLLDQWITRCRAELGLTKADLGIVRGTKRRLGDRVTLALQQTLFSLAQDGQLALLGEAFGALVVDECHGVAARTFQAVIGAFGARYRIGFSADETRRDRKEFLVYAAMGPIVQDIERQDLIRDQVILPVTVRLVPTEFRADWYRDGSTAERDFGRLLDEMAQDDTRTTLVAQTIQRATREGPTFCFVHRREYAKHLADQVAFSLGIPCGLLLGGDQDAVRFEEDRGRLERGQVDLAVGTVQAIGQGIDVPRVSRGILATPIGANRQFFGQVAGRICRQALGKRDAILYYLWDRSVFPNQPQRLRGWCDRLEVLDGDQFRQWTK